MFPETPHYRKTMGGGPSLLLPDSSLAELREGFTDTREGSSRRSVSLPFEPSTPPALLTLHLPSPVLPAMACGQLCSRTDMTTAF